MKVIDFVFSCVNQVLYSNPSKKCINNYPSNTVQNTLTGMVRVVVKRALNKGNKVNQEQSKEVFGRLIFQ